MQIIPGFALGSVEGRVAIHYINAVGPKDNFTFKCHRSNGTQNGYQVEYKPYILQFITINVSLIFSIQPSGNIRS